MSNCLCGTNPCSCPLTDSQRRLFDNLPKASGYGVLRDRLRGYSGRIEELQKSNQAVLEENRKLRENLVAERAAVDALDREFAEARAENNSIGVQEIRNALDGDDLPLRWDLADDVRKMRMERDQLRAELASLRGELATIFGVAIPRKGETQNAAWLRVIGELLSRECAKNKRLAARVERYEKALTRIREDGQKRRRESFATIGHFSPEMIALTALEEQP